MRPLTILAVVFLLVSPLAAQAPRRGPRRRRRPRHVRRPQST